MECCWNSLRDTGLRFSWAHLRSLFMWVIHMMVLDSWHTTCAGPHQRPFSSMLGDFLRSQYIQSCPQAQTCWIPRDCRARALLRASLLSARQKAARADALSSRRCRKRSDAGSAPWHDRCALKSSSATMDAGSLDALPSTACSGLKPSMMDKVFLAWKHWRKASSNSAKSLMFFSWSILFSISLMVPPCLSILPLCHGAAERMGRIPFSCSMSFHSSVTNSPPGSWARLFGALAHWNHDCLIILMALCVSRVTLWPRWKRVASSKMWRT